jgi:N utilization substance protein B
MREVVFQLLFSLDIDAQNPSAVVAFIGKELAVSKKYVLQALDKANAILQNKEDLDKRIAAISVSYVLERIQKVEINILRLGAYEILFDNEIPPKVAIAEGMRLAKKFSTPESASYINAVLDSIYKQSEGKSVDVTEITKSVKAMEEIEAISEEASHQALPPSNDDENKDDENVDF